MSVLPTLLDFEKKTAILVAAIFRGKLRTCANDRCIAKVDFLIDHIVLLQFK